MAKKKKSPKEAGPRIYQDKKTGLFHMDLRKWGGGRPVIRDPNAREGESRGTRNRKEAKEWAIKIQQAWRKRQAEEEFIATGIYRRLDLAADAVVGKMKLELKPSTVAATRTALSHLRAVVGDDKDPARITEIDIVRLLSAMQARGLKPNTLWLTRVRLSRFFDAIKVSPNPVQDIEMSEDAPNVKPWTAEEVRRIRAAADELDSERKSGVTFSYRRLVEFLLCTGARIQEAAGAEWDDVLTEAGIARILRQIARETNLPRATKARRMRAVILLKEWKAVHDPSGQGLIFTLREGEAIGYRKLYDLVKAVLVRAGLKERGECAHKFRHTYAYLVIKRKGTLHQLSESLGHTRIATTEKYYKHFASEETARQAAEQVNRSDPEA